MVDQREIFWLTTDSDLATLLHGLSLSVSVFKFEMREIQHSVNRAVWLVLDLSC